MWLRLMLALAILWIPADVLDIFAIGDALNSDGTSSLLDLSDLVAGILAMAQLIFLLGTGITFIRWISLAVRVVRLTGGTVRHPGWVVWGWIVPIMSLFRPKQIVNDLHAATEYPAHPASPARAVVNWWWGDVDRQLHRGGRRAPVRDAHAPPVPHRRLHRHRRPERHDRSRAAGDPGRARNRRGAHGEAVGGGHAQRQMPPPPADAVPGAPPPGAPPLPDGWAPPVAPAPVSPPPPGPPVPPDASR